MKFYTNVVMLGNEILSRGYNNGKSFIERETFYPKLFVVSNNKTKYKTLEGLFVEEISPGTIRETREFIKTYSGVSNFQLYGNTRYATQYISDHYPGDVHYDINKINLITIDIEVESENGFPDVKSCQEKLLTISIQNYQTKHITTWGIKNFQVKEKNITYHKCSDEYELLSNFISWWQNNCPDIITGWNCTLYDIPYLYGRLSKVLGEKSVKQLSPWKIVNEQTINISGRDYDVYDIYGISVLDYLDLYKKFTYVSQESYSLNHIAFVELGEQKLDHSEYETFKEFYTKDWQKFVEYNQKDVSLVDRLEDKLKLIEIAITMAYDTKCNFSDVFYQVRMWDSIIYNYLKDRNIVIPFMKESEKNDKYMGAYVKEPIPGMYNYVVSFDVNSMYPHLIMQHSISPETLVTVDDINDKILELESQPSSNSKIQQELDSWYKVRKLSSEITIDKVLNKSLDLSPLKNLNLTITPNGALYNRVSGFLPELMEKFYDERVIYKEKMIEAKKKYEKTKDTKLLNEISKCNNIQLTRKVQLNSAYGSIGTPYFRFYKVENAEAITAGGQAAIRWIENKLNKYLNDLLKTDNKDFCIALDTDAVYLNMEALVEKVYEGKEKKIDKIVDFLDKVCKTKIEKYIEESYLELAEYLNAYDQKLHMKRECIAERGIWTAKKRYILNVLDNEGVRYETPKLKIMGIEAIKSSTPTPCKKMIKEALKIIMNQSEDDLIEYVQECKTNFYKFEVEEISFPRTASNLDKYRSSAIIYEKKCPIQIRGSLLYNHYITKNNLTNKYPIIKNGEKVKFCYLKTPNIIGENVFSFIQRFPKELNLEKYIDYDLQFEKGFLDPLNLVLQHIGWKFEKINTLETLFG